ncbi:hypothetical protein AgCh_039835 [Apium graveolens]
MKVHQWGACAEVELEHVEGESSGKKLSEEAREDCMQNSKRGGWTTFPYIIGTELGLSPAATGWGCNLTVYLITVFSLKSIHATQISSIVAGSSNLFPIAGAILADSFFGSFSVISIFSIISLSVSSLYGAILPKRVRSSEMPYDSSFLIVDLKSFDENSHLLNTFSFLFDPSPTLAKKFLNALKASSMLLSM